MVRLFRFGSSASGATRVSARYRRSPGGWLLAALLVVPLALALLGSLWLDGETSSTASPGQQAGGAAVPAPRAPDLEAIEVTRERNRVVVAGRVPDKAAEQGLLNSVRGAAGNARVVNEISVEDGVRTPPLAGIGTVLSAARGIDDFGLRIDGSTLAISGSAPDQQTATSAVFAAGQSYPGLQLDDGLSITGPDQPAPATAPTPLTPKCDALRTEVTEALKQQPVIFALEGADVDAASKQRLRELGQRLSSCSFTSIEVAGHTDSTGSERYNRALSQKRAESVRQILVLAGVPGDRLTARGYGSTEPVADNATDAGRVANRRVEISAE